MFPSGISPTAVNPGWVSGINPFAKDDNYPCRVRVGFAANVPTSAQLQRTGLTVLLAKPTNKTIQLNAAGQVVTYQRGDC